MSPSPVPDVLPGFVQTTLPLSEPGLVATLVTHEGEAGDGPAVIYVHGYNDYFFQTELAERWRAAGFAFHALDLRRHGRSLRPGQQPCWVTDLEAYFEDLDRAVQVIRQKAPERPLVLLGHSTGGLIGSLWADARPGVLAGLILNSPFLGWSGPGYERWFLSRVATPLAAVAPRAVIQADGGPLYASSLHQSFGRGGEWDYDLTWKRAGGLPILAGWVRAIEHGHRRVRRGLSIVCPVLVLSSARSGGGSTWNTTFQTTDAVLDVRDMRRRARRLGPRVDQVVLEGALHDVVLSAKPVRERAYEEMVRWAGAVVGG